MWRGAPRSLAVAGVIVSLVLGSMPMLAHGGPVEAAPLMALATETTPSVEPSTPVETSPTPPPAGDTAPPVTTSDAVAVYIESARISLVATDGPTGSGVAHTYHVIDGGLRIEGRTVTISSIGTHRLEYWSVDASDNVEPANRKDFEVRPAPDTVAPVTTSDAKASYAGTATIRLSATDNAGGSGIAYTVYRLDGSHPVTGTVVTVAALGQHTLEFWSADVANNQESPHGVVSFTVLKAPDVTPPTTASDAKASYIGPATIHLTAADDPGGSGGVRTFFRLNGGTQFEGALVICSVVGTNTLEYWSTDASGNVEPHNVRTFTVAEPPIVDPIAPTTTSDARSSYIESATIRLTPSDNVGGTGVKATYYRLDGQQWEGTLVHVTTEGAHTLEYWSVDTAGNIEARKLRTFIVNSLLSLDHVAPTTTSDVRSSYVGSGTIHLMAQDDPGGSGVRSIHFRLDGQEWEGPSVVVTKSGDHVLEYWSVDAAGNVEPPSLRMFTVAATPPSTACSYRATYYGMATLDLVAARHPLGSQVLTTYFELDGVRWEGDQVIVTGIGSHTLTYWSVDVDGTAESPHTIRFSVVKAKASVSIRYLPASVRRGRSFGAWGYLSPRHPAGTWPVLLDCYRYQSGRWVRRKLVDAKVVDYGSISRYSLRFTLPHAGKWRIRARHADAQHQTSVSAYRYVTVR